jgi:tripartite-type tricarboxylate transporter receptor subunit TctC
MSMLLHRKIFRGVSVLLVAALAAAAPASAQTWPEKPVRIIVAFAPGGLIDTFARTLQPRLVEGLGQPVIIENRGGAGGTLAEAMLAKSAPDGYTMMVSADSPPANPHLFRNLSYDFFRDLAPVSMLTRVPFALVVHPSVPAASLPEFVAYVRSRQGQFAYASPGTGTGNHLFMELLKSLAGIEMTHVPYKGGGPAMTDLIGGQVQASLISITLAAPQSRSGKVRAVGVTSERRAPLLPLVQTFVEAGYGNFTPHTWCGLFVPAGTPAAIVQRLHAEFAKAVRAPEVQTRFQELGAETVMNSSGEFAQFLRTESERLGTLIKQRNISSD